MSYGVKVTFFSSGLKDLKSNCSSYKNIEVASIETIIAMKMQAIISYRTKTRDFYDIYSISEQQDISIFTMLDMYNSHTTKKVKEELLYTCFVTNPLDDDDEGLDGMDIKKKNMSSFSKLREWIIDEVKKNKTQEEKIILCVLENPSLIEEYKDFYFGFQRLSLPQKLASIDQSNMVIKCIALNTFDIAYEDISGKNILDYYLTAEENEVFEKILQYTTIIPSAWLESKTYRREGKIEAIQCENYIINSIAKSHTNERMKIVAEKCGISFEEYAKRIEVKRTILG